MREPRRSWRKIIASCGIAPGSDEETAFIEKHFPDANVLTFSSDLSRGFSAEFTSLIERVCKVTGHDFQRDLWIRPSSKEGFGRSHPIRYVGKKVLEPVSFYTSLEDRYRGAEHYECVRVGGIFSRNRDSLVRIDGVLRPNPDSIRLPYVKLFWEHLLEQRLSGTAVHVVRSVDRLVELWACAEFLQRRKRRHSNQLYLAPVNTSASAPDYPVMGVRVVDERWTLMSIPPQKPRDSWYSSWIDSEPLAEFQGRYVKWATQCSHIISDLPPLVLEHTMKQAFRALRHVETESSNHGPLDSFTQARALKNEMLGLAEEGSWYPVVA